jgi:hypothetical protein
MTSRRDHLFPATSIGRSPSPVGVPRTGSYESLSAHPLLSSTPSYAGVSADQANGSNTTPPKYVPYTPRQRGIPSSATTGTTLQPSVVSVSPQHASGGDAKSKLQLMSLKAAAQGAGLDTGSIGWAILERLVEGEHGPEWAQIWEAITTEKVCTSSYLPESLYKQYLHPGHTTTSNGSSTFEREHHRRLRQRSRRHM